MEPITTEMKKSIQLDVSRELQSVSKKTEQLTEKVAGLEKQVSRHAEETGEMF